MRRSPAAISARTARRRELAVTEAAGGRPLALAAAMQSRAAGANAARLAHDLAIGHYLMMRLAAEAQRYQPRPSPSGTRAPTPPAWSMAAMARASARSAPRRRNPAALSPA